MGRLVRQSPVCWPAWVELDVLPEIGQKLRGKLGQHHDIPKDKLQAKRGAETHAQHLRGGARYE